MKRRASDKDKNKENHDLLKMELAKWFIWHTNELIFCRYNGDLQKLQLESYRLHSEHNRHDKVSSKQEAYGSKTSRRLDKSEDLKLASKSKKPVRSESSTNLLRDKDRSRVTDHDLYTEERMANMRALANMVILYIKLFIRGNRQVAIWLNNQGSVLID